MHLHTDWTLHRRDRLPPARRHPPLPHLRRARCHRCSTPTASPSPSAAPNTSFPDRTRRVVHTPRRWLRHSRVWVRPAPRECTTSIHWDDDGPTETWNLISLCPHHHRLHHQGKLGITGNADIPGGLIFTDADGRVHHRQRGQTQAPRGRYHHRSRGNYQHPLGQRLDMKWVSFGTPPEHREHSCKPTSAQTTRRHRLALTATPPVRCAIDMPRSPPSVPGRGRAGPCRHPVRRSPAR